MRNSRSCEAAEFAATAPFPPYGELRTGSRKHMLSTWLQNMTAYSAGHKLDLVQQLIT